MLGALRDMRIWGIMVLGLVLSSALWAVLGIYVVSTLDQREKALSQLSPEQRREADLHTMDHLSREVLGQEGIPVSQLMAEQRYLVAELEARGIEEEERAEALLEELQMGAPTRDPSSGSPREKTSLPAPLGSSRTPEKDPVSPLFAALGCGGAILLLGALGAVLLFRTGGED